MNDDTFDNLWTTLEPSAIERRRIDTRVAAWLDAHDTSLVSEWLALFRVEPVAAAGLVTASVASLATAPPIMWVIRSLL
jgi:hypothetical protein